MKKTKKIAPRSIKRVFPNVKFLEDAKSSINVHVKATDCKIAIARDATECALAKATKRELHADAVIIGLSTSYIIKGNKAIRYNTGQRIAREIVSFDRHNDFEPDIYTLSPKSPSLRLGVKYNSGVKLAKKHEPRRKIHLSARVRNLTND